MVIGRCTAAINDAMRNFSYYKTVEFVCATCVPSAYTIITRTVLILRYKILLLYKRATIKQKDIIFNVTYYLYHTLVSQTFRKMLKKINYIQG